MPKARENAGYQVVIGFFFLFATYRLRKRRKFSGTIREQSKAKPMRSRITFDSQLKVAKLLNVLG